MKTIPYLKNENGIISLIVDGKPFLGLGGEFHNSSASNLEYMDREVWPAVRPLNGNCYLAPVYWECMERVKGVYDFTLVDGLIDQARREGVRLGLLWFGEWKSGRSLYIPAWLKTDENIFYMRGQNGELLESCSPYCEYALELNIKAYRALMQHIREYDAEEQTVILMQVENEPGVWFQPRDYCAAAEADFRAQIPAEMAAHFGVSGTWQEAFGDMGGEYMMAWAFGKALQRLCAAGKEEYPLPTFTNTMTMPVGYPSGAPMPPAFEVWRLAAPDLDILSPNAYGPTFRLTAESFVRPDNPMLVPELGADTDAAGKVFYAAAEQGCLVFSPFGVEDMTKRPNVDAATVGEAYTMVQGLWPMIDQARREGRVRGFTQVSEGSTDFVLGGYKVTVSYHSAPNAGGPGGFPGMGGGRSIKRAEGSSVPGGFVMWQGNDSFLVCGVNFSVSFAPVEKGSRTQVFVLDKKELLFTGEGFNERRSLNGDERNAHALGAKPAAFSIKLYRRV